MSPYPYIHAALTLLFACALAGAVDGPHSPWAAEVVAYEPVGHTAPYDSPDNALGPPLGFGPSVPNNDTIVSLGEAGGSITLRMANPVENHPDNPMGLDFIVYSNAFWVGGNPQRRWQSPGIVEIAMDPGGPWRMIPGSRVLPPSPFPRVEEPDGLNNEPPFPPELLAGAIRNPNTFDGDPATDAQQHNWGYADMSPTLQPYLDNYVRPRNPFETAHTPRAGGGDAFDISWAVDSDGEPANMEAFQYIRITTLVDRDMLQLGQASTEVMAVAAVAPNVDTSGNGILDAWERYIGTDVERPENTVLPLEIPSIEGGGPAGTILGTAEDSDGNRIRLFAGESRTQEGRAYNTIVDIREADDPGAPLPGDQYLPSGAVREFITDVSDFVDAGIEPAQFIIAYRAADIAGLDEEGLRPFRYSNGAFVSNEITDISVNPGARTVTFRSRYPGLFILAAGEGGGASEQPGPQGAISLTAEPPDSIAAGPDAVVTVTSSVVNDEEGEPVADGTLFTVSTTRGAIASPDAAPGQSGVQVESADGRISFTVAAGSQSGGAVFSAASVQGSAQGELTYAVVAGPPAPPVTFRLGPPEGEAPVNIPVHIERVRDAHGNTVADGTLLTVSTQSADIVSGDARDDLPGHQVALTNGQATFFIETGALDEMFVIRAYTDAEASDLVGEAAFTAQDFTPLPAASAFALAALTLLMAAGAAWSLVRQRATGGPTP